MTKKVILAAFLRSQARWRLDIAGASARRVARNVVALLEAADYVAGIPDDDRDLTTLEWAGCFRGGWFYPGEAGLAIIRGWQLADQTTAGPSQLLAALADAISADAVVASTRYAANGYADAGTGYADGGYAVSEHRRRPRHALTLDPNAASWPDAAANRSDSRVAVPA